MAIKNRPSGAERYAHLRNQQADKSAESAANNSQAAIDNQELTATENNDCITENTSQDRVIAAVEVPVSTQKDTALQQDNNSELPNDEDEFHEDSPCADELQDTNTIANTDEISDETAYDNLINDTINFNTSKLESTTANNNKNAIENAETDNFSGDIYIQTVVRTSEEIKRAKERNELRKAIQLEHTLNVQTNTDSLNEGSDLSEIEQTSSIYINESEVSDEMEDGKRKKTSKNKKNAGFFKTLPRLFKHRSKPRNFLISLIFTTGKLFITLILVLGCSGLGAVLGLAKSYVESIPTLDFSVFTDTALASVIYDVNGNVITNYYGSENREWAKIDEIPQDLKNAIVAIEDVRFYRHMGLDFKRLIGSLIKNFTSDSVQGGSTITQQLVKNQLLSSEQTYKRKIREAYIAIELENMYEKDEILEFYCNTIPLGGLIYGVKTAAKEYFNKELSELTLLECAMLAGITNNPTRYNPRTNYYTRNNPAQTNKRTALVLDEMYTNGFIEKDEYDENIATLNNINALWTDFAINQTITQEEYRQGLSDLGLVIYEKSPISSNNEMLYFVEYAVHDAITQLLKANNYEDTQENRLMIDNLIRENGYSIYTTLDPEKQLAAEDAVYNYQNYPSMRNEADKYVEIGKNPDGSVQTLVQPQAAAVVIDYRNGHIVAMVGGRQEPTGLKTFNRAYQSTMPVGSSIKPLAVYGPAIESGLAAGSIMYDTKSPIRGWDTELGYPRNYNNTGYTGAMTLRTALTKSTNTVAAQTLMYYVGAENAYNTLVALGINPDNIQRDGPGLALGTSGIPTLEMAGAYSAIANMGQYIQPISFTKIVDKDGNVVLDMQARQERRQVFKQSTAYQLIDMLTYALKTNKSKALIDGQVVGGKTGTTMESRGVFFSGFSGYYTCAVWIGSDKYKPLASSTTGSSHAAGLFHDIMEPLHANLANDRPIADLTDTSLGIKKMEFCRYSGKLATEHCRDTFQDIALEADLITTPCTCHGEVVICIETGCIATEQCIHKMNVKTLTLPIDGQLAYMYGNYPEIYKEYWPEPSPVLITCGKHSGHWTEEFTQKVMLRKQYLEYIEQVEQETANATISNTDKDSLNGYILQLEMLCNDIENTTIDQYNEAYNALYNFMMYLFPPEIPDDPQNPDDPDNPNTPTGTQDPQLNPTSPVE